MNWLTIKEAAGVLSPMSASTLRRIILNRADPAGRPVIEFSKPSPGRYLLLESSVLAFRDAVEADPHFWEAWRVVSRPKRRLKVVAGGFSKGCKA